MRTLIISDSTCSAAGVDLLRRPELRAQLLEALADVDRLVLLGDLLELRHGPPRGAGRRSTVLRRSRPGDGNPTLPWHPAAREIVAVAGNHDHALIETWLEHRSELPAPPPLGVEQRIEAGAASSMMALLAEWSAPAAHRSYPGLWVRPDVYATHGHYLTATSRSPPRTLRDRRDGPYHAPPHARLHRARRLRGGDGAGVSWIDAVARQAPTGDAINGGMTVRAWRALGGAPQPTSSPAASDESVANGEPSQWPAGGIRELSRTRSRELARMLRNRALAGAFPLGVAALNRAGLGPFNADLSSNELRRAGLRAMGEVAARLGVGDAHVVFGHTHRAGPLPGDDLAEWRGPGGARLINTGCWTYDAYFLTPTPGESPYWPGSCVLVEDDGPPVLRRLLESRHPHGAHASPGVKQVARHSTPAPTSSSSTPAVWRSCSISG